MLLRLPLSRVVASVLSAVRIRANRLGGRRLMLSSLSLESPIRPDPVARSQLPLSFYYPSLVRLRQQSIENIDRSAWVRWARGPPAWKRISVSALDPFVTHVISLHPLSNCYLVGGWWGEAVAGDSSRAVIAFLKDEEFWLAFRGVLPVE